MALRFTREPGERRGELGWSIEEAGYDPRLAGTIESIFALGNGYMGVRAATEERYAYETRGFYVAGVFDAFPGEVTELCNLPDWLNLELEIEGERFTCESGRLESFRRALDLRSGLLTRSLVWVSPGGRRIKVQCERFLSLAEVHVGALRVTLEALGFSGSVRVVSGVDGRVTNSGVQHLCEEQLRVLPGGVVASLSRTQESGIEVCVAATHRYSVDGRPVTPEERVVVGRRRVLLASELRLEKGSTLTIAKYACLHSDRDHARRRDDGDEREQAGDRARPPGADGSTSGAADVPPAPGTVPSARGQRGGESPLLERASSTLASAAATGFDALFDAHRAEWDTLWQRIDVSITGPDFDQLALRFALFHILQMTPRRDPRSSIAAKGLTGEGYKGHVFWDTEIFVLPVYIYTMPDMASRLLEYRYRTLEGARRKARHNGYRGAMYPWESANSGDETTPSFWGVDAVTGRPIPILSGSLEQHINVEIPFAVNLYHLASGDDRFLVDMGLEIMLETARFWASRLEWKAERERYEITDIMGPDEYGEHVSNNAYTNHMVAWHLRTTAGLFDTLSGTHPRRVAALADRVGFSTSEKEEWLEKASKLFTNVDEASGFICQYDGFTEKRAIDLAKYRSRLASITADFGWEELMKLQVVKQADTVMLLYLRGDDFSSDTKRLNWRYYEPKTLHDSSLSPAIHSIVASDMGDREKAYDYFQRAARIDLQEAPTGSTDGVHAAALGGVWQAAVNGFAGVRLTGDGRLRISPRLPEQWERMEFPLLWRGRALRVEVTKGLLRIGAPANGAAFEVECDGVAHTHPGSGTIEIALG